jgi:hypothetical protein
MQSLDLEREDFARLIAEFSSSLEAQQSIVAAIERIERQISASSSFLDSQLSRFLLEQLTDPVLRRQAEVAIAAP